MNDFESLFLERAHAFAIAALQSSTVVGAAAVCGFHKDCRELNVEAPTRQA